MRSEFGASQPQHKPKIPQRQPGRNLLFGLALVVIVVSGCLIALTLVYMRSQAIESGKRLTESFAHVIEEQTTRTFQTVDQRLQLAASSLAQLQASGKLDTQSVRALLHEQAKELPFARVLFVVDTQGRITYDSNGSSVGVDVADRAYFQIYQTQPLTTFHISPPLRGRVSGKWVINAVRPLYSTDGKFSGLIVASVEPPYFEELWSSVNLGMDGSVILFRRDGVLMMRSPFDDAVMGKEFAGRPLFSDLLPRNPAGNFDIASPIDGIVRMFSYRTLSAQPGLAVVVGQSYQVVLAPWRQLATVGIATWAAASLAIAILCAFLNQAWQQRMQTEARVQDMAQRLTLATDAAAIGVWDWDLQADQWYATPTYFTMLGYEPEEGFVSREQWLERIHPEDKDVVAQKIQAMLLSGDGDPYHYEARLRHADGSYRWVSVSGRVLAHTPEGKASRLLGIRVDITERKENEAALKASEARYRELFESNPHPMWVYDLETLAFLAVNDAAVAHYGYSHEEFLAMTIRDIRPADDLERLEQELHQARLGRTKAGLWHHCRKDGSIIRVEITSHALKFGDRQAKLVLANDVTERKRAEDKLRLSEENLAITLQSIGDAVIATDATGRITRMNATAERLTGWALAEATGRSLPDVFQIIHAQTRTPAANPVQLVMASGDVVGLANHTALLARDGKEYQISDSGAPIRDASGQIVGVVLVFSDVTEAYRVRQSLATTAELLERTGEVAKVGGWELDLQTMQPFWSKETCRIHEVDPLVAPSLDQAINFYAPSARATIQTAVQAGIQFGTPWDLELPMITAKGKHRWVRAQGFPMIEDGKVTKLLGAFHDITDSKQAENTLRETALHTQTILDNMLDCVFTSTMQGVIESFNKSACTVFGYTLEEVQGKNVSMLIPDLHGQQHDSYIENYQKTGESRVIGISREVQGKRKDGSIFPMSLSVSKVTRAGQTTFIGVARDITQRRQDEEEIRRLAFYDALTGLPNRRLLMDRLKQAMATSARTTAHGALMFLDLDHFKSLNDSLGHDVGDVLLQQVATRLQSCVREGDSVARLGGDEFVVLLEALSAHDHEAATQAEIIANKILDTLRKTYNLHGHTHHTTASIGIVVFMGDHDALDDLLKKADLAMYQAKSAGRNAAHFFDPAMQAAVAAHDSLITDMRRGLTQQEFVLHYQIQVNGDGATTGVEALVRWSHALKGMVPPMQFITLAEETGLILPLGQWVLETACAQLVTWADQPATAHWTMAVNVSASQFAQTDFVEHIAQALQKTGANPCLLKLELTESTLVDDVEDVIVKMNAIKAFGVGFSLDDFGTGYSSLSYLKRLPLDQLKIDQSFVRDVLTDPSDAVIARTILALGHSLGLTVIAEGVETAEQRNFLVSSGCAAFQGYYFGHPMAAHALLQVHHQANGDVN